MLPKEKRLRNTKDFKKVYQKGAFLFGTLVSINFLNNRTHETRIGVVVTKKFSSKAVLRNKVKRNIREAAHSLYDMSPRGYDIIINAKNGSNGASVSDIKKELQGLLSKVGKNEKNNPFYN